MEKYLDSQKENYPHLYTVTDPCYLLDNERWQKCCRKADEAGKAQGMRDWDFDAFNKAVEDELRSISGGFVYVCGTGFGDWENRIYAASRPEKVIIKQACFGADAGMVCVVEVTDKLEDYLEHEYTDNSFAIGAFFRSKEPVDYVVTLGSRSWEVLQIAITNGGVVRTEDDLDTDYEDEE
ncbi:MAG: hypothetical protein NC218_03310 [Acetobacter sp.]|nr:hypothetical protein [Acetobacter sp.]